MIRVMRAEVSISYPFRIHAAFPVPVANNDLKISLSSLFVAIRSERRKHAVRMSGHQTINAGTFDGSFKKSLENSTNFRQNSPN